MSLAANAARMIARKGETMTLRRAGETDLALKGKRADGSTENIGGSAVQQNFRVRIAPTELAASGWADKKPKRKDSLVVSGRTLSVIDASPISDGSVVAMYVLEVSG